MHIYINNIYIYINAYTARTGVLPGEVGFNCAWPVFFACWYVGEMATWLTRLVSKTQNPKPQIQILKPKSDMKRKKALKVTSY